MPEQVTFIAVSVVSITNDVEAALFFTIDNRRLEVISSHLVMIEEKIVLLPIVLVHNHGNHVVSTKE